MEIDWIDIHTYISIHYCIFSLLSDQTLKWCVANCKLHTRVVLIYMYTYVHSSENKLRPFAKLG